jgi:hypothetical protein
MDGSPNTLAVRRHAWRPAELALGPGMRHAQRRCHYGVGVRCGPEYPARHREGSRCAESLRQRLDELSPVHRLVVDDRRRRCCTLARAAPARGPPRWPPLRLRCRSRRRPRRRCGERACGAAAAFRPAARCPLPDRRIVRSVGRSPRCQRRRRSDVLLSASPQGAGRTCRAGGTANGSFSVRRGHSHLWPRPFARRCDRRSRARVPRPVAGMRLVPARIAPGQRRHSHRAGPAASKGVHMHHPQRGKATGQVGAEECAGAVLREHGS